MKIVAHDLKYMIDSKGNLVLSITISHDMYHNQNIARRLVNELQDKKIEASFKEHKSQRSIDQNSMLWALIGKISDKVNGSHREEDMQRVYHELLIKGNIKREYFRGIKDSIRVFQEYARAVVIIPNSERVESNGTTTIGFWVYLGSSKFNVKEMNELIDLALDTCVELGIDDSELHTIKNEYKGVRE